MSLIKLAVNFQELARNPVVRHATAGAAIGGITGGAIGATTGGKNQSKLKRGIVGATTGAFTGGMIGAHGTLLGEAAKHEGGTFQERFRSAAETAKQHAKKAWEQK